MNFPYKPYYASASLTVYCLGLRVVQWMAAQPTALTPADLGEMSLWLLNLIRHLHREVGLKTPFPVQVSFAFSAVFGLPVDPEPMGGDRVSSRIKRRVHGSIEA